MENGKRQPVNAISGNLVGEVVRDGQVVSRQYEQFDPLLEVFCWLHPNIYRRLENPHGFTERDKKIMATIRLKPFKTKDKKGKVTMGRMCPRCFNSVIIPDSKKTAIFKG